MSDYGKGPYVIDWDAVNAARSPELLALDARADAARRAMLEQIRATEAAMFAACGAIPLEWEFTCEDGKIVARSKGWRVFDVAPTP